LAAMAAEIEQKLTSAGGQRHLNEISTLFALCEAEDLRDVAAALQAIARVLVHHRRVAVEAAAKQSSEGKVSDELVAWLRKHGEAFHALLLTLAGSGEPRAQACAVRLAIAATRDEASEISASKGLRLDLGRLFGLHPPEKRVQDLVSELLLAERWSSQVADCLLNEFVKEFADVRHYVIGHIRSCAEQVGKSTASEEPKEEEAVAKKRRRLLGPFAESVLQRGRSHEEIFVRLLGLLREAPEPQAPPAASVDAEEEVVEDNILAATGRPSGHYRREYRRVFQDAWLKLLGLRVPLTQCSPLLQLLPSQVIPHLSRPLMLSDFYLRAFHTGSIELSVLALSGLLLLLTTHGLGDPETLSASCGEFYAQLFSLLQPATFRLKRRARFQRLAAAALTSGLLPARFAAAFAKKCLRVAISSSEPGAIMWLLSVAYGLIQRNHSHCSFLLHRTSQTEGAELPPAISKDPFSAEAALPEAAVQVVESSAWELQLLLRHHMPAISTLAKLFEKPFFKPSARKLDPELCLDQGPVMAYGQALKAADREVSKLKKRGQRCPLAFKVEDDEEAMRVTGWAAALSTGQRRIGAGL